VSTSCAIAAVRSADDGGCMCSEHERVKRRPELTSPAPLPAQVLPAGGALRLRRLRHRPVLGPEQVRLGMRMVRRAYAQACGRTPSSFSQRPPLFSSCAAVPIARPPSRAVTRESCPACAWQAGLRQDCAGLGGDQDRHLDGDEPCGDHVSALYMWPCTRCMWHLALARDS
jgi:hypothetical protein